MPSRLDFLQRSLAAVGCMVVAGCVGSGGRSDSIAERQPAMPTVTPRVVAALVPIVEADVVAAALRSALGNELAAAGRAIESLPDPVQRARLSAEVATRLAAVHPERAGEFALALSSAAARSAGLEIAAAALVRQDPDAALRWGEGISDAGVAGIARAAVARQLVQVDARAAVERIAARPASPSRDDTLGFAAAAWARGDGKAAVAWLRSRPEDALKRRLTSTIGFEIAQQHPDQAIELAETLPAGRDRWLLFSAIAQTWVATNPKEALAWAGRLPDGDARAAALAGVDTGLGVPTARRTISVPGARGVRSRGFGGGVTEAALEAGDSADFAAWLATRPAGRSRDEEIIEYVQQRGAADSGAIGQWLTTLAPGPARDRAMEIYLEGQLIGAPHRAASWLRSLPRSDRSDAMIERTARAWLQTNPEAASAWLRETALPLDRKERLLREAGR